MSLWHVGEYCLKHSMRESFLLRFMSPSLMSVGNAFHATSWCLSWPSEGDTLPSTAWQNDKFRRWRKTNFHRSHLAPPLPVCSGGVWRGDQTRDYCQMFKRQKTRSYFFKNSGLGATADRMVRLVILAKMWLPVWLLMGRWHPGGWYALNMSCLHLATPLIKFFYHPKVV